MFPLAIFPSHSALNMSCLYAWQIKIARGSSLEVWTWEKEPRTFITWQSDFKFGWSVTPPAISRACQKTRSVPQEFLWHRVAFASSDFSSIRDFFLQKSHSYTFFDILSPLPKSERSKARLVVNKGRWGAFSAVSTAPWISRQKAFTRTKKTFS
jgi:hypothetical protein